ncbi:MAG: 16S rRNA (cytosine(967)-C(5))-methyltransferase RsmB [Nitrospirae bacterium]|nr:16S rRNA (cytosine(967)-C(5))-methyltransferase RsmB [Nitrospirota bacterium]
MMSSHSSPSGKNPKTYNARSLALQILRDVQEKSSLADQALDVWLGKVAFQPADRALTHDLVYGVLRHRDTLDWRLNLVAHRPIHKLPQVILWALRLGVYQLLYLDKIPPSAAVNESVNLVKHIKGTHWKGLVNGMLRTLSREDSPPFPDVTTDPLAGLSVRYSCPTWLVERWMDHLGFDRAEKACRSTTQIPPLTLRTNTLRGTREELQNTLQEQGLHPKPTLVSSLGLTIDKCGPLSEVAALQEGWCYVEDEAAQLIPLILDVQPGHRVWDTCAAPGGKTTHIAALMQNQGEIVATDRQAQRLDLLSHNSARLGISIITPLVFDLATNEEGGLEAPNIESPSGSSGSCFNQPFDRILVDAPCSGLGTLRRHPEAKWSRTVEQLKQHHISQLHLLEQTSNYLRPGGVLVYSACSGEPEEGEQVIARFLRDHPEFAHEVSTPWLPSSGRSLVNQNGNLMTLGVPLDMDGFFAARLRKKEVF